MQPRSTSKSPDPEVYLSPECSPDNKENINSNTTTIKMELEESHKISIKRSVSKSSTGRKQRKDKKPGPRGVGGYLVNKDQRKAQKKMVEMASEVLLERSKRGRQIPLGASGVVRNQTMDIESESESDGASAFFSEHNELEEEEKKEDEEWDFKMEEFAYKKEDIELPKEWSFVDKKTDYTPPSLGKMFENRVLKKHNRFGNLKRISTPIEFLNLFLDDTFFQLIVDYTNHKAHLFQSTIASHLKAEQEKEEKEKEEQEQEELVELEVEIKDEGDSLLEEKIEEEYNEEQIKVEENFKENSKPKKSHQAAWKDVTCSEIKAFFSILLHMGITKAPTFEFYWLSDPQFRVQGIARIMSRDRFNQIKRHMYFNDGLVDPTASKDRIAKIRPIFDHLLAACKRNWLYREFITIDESMIRFKGRHSGVCYIPRKPTPKGFKIYVMADTDNYVVNFIPSFVLQGENHNLMNIINTLTEGLDGKGFHLFLDSYFTTVDVVKSLQKRNLYVTACMAGVRVPFYNQKNRAQIHDVIRNNQVVFWKYKDHANEFTLCGFQTRTKPCFIISTCYGNQMVALPLDLGSGPGNITYGTITHEDKGEIIELHGEAEEEKEEKVDKEGTLEIKDEAIADSTEELKPEIVTKYCKFMKNVDTYNQVASYYFMNHRFIKWYRVIVIWLLEVGINNAYTLYRERLGRKAVCHLKFRQEIIKDLQKDFWESKVHKEEKKKKPAGNRGCCRLDRAENGAALDCIYCSHLYKGKRVRTTWICAACQVHVCPRCFHLHFYDKRTFY